MKTELMVILESKRLEKEGKKLDNLYKRVMDTKDEEGNVKIDPGSALAMQTAIAINKHQQKTIQWVLDNEPIKTTL